MTDSDEPEQAVAFDIKAACQRLLEILQDKETIGKSLKRLNSEKGKYTYSVYYQMLTDLRA